MTTETTTAAFTKVLRLGTVPIYTRNDGTGPRHSVYVKIEFSADGKLSLTGVEGPRPSGNATGGCGQINMSMDDAYLNAMTFAPGWNMTMVAQLLAYWREWHLNDMQAGSPRQMAYLKAHPLAPEDYAYPNSYFDVARATLALAGLEPDRGYKYGSAWLRVEVPQDVLDWLRALPDADRAPAWC